MSEELHVHCAVFYVAVGYSAAAHEHFGVLTYPSIHAWGS